LKKIIENVQATAVWAFENFLRASAQNDLTATLPA